MVPIKPHGNLLLDERPLVVLPALAMRFGLNEAIILQQLHYWVGPTTGLSTNIVDGVKWAYNTYEEWQQQFPWWSVRTIQRIFTTLERQGVVTARAMNVKDWDRRKWYTIDYAIYNQLVADAGLATAPDGALDDDNLAPSSIPHRALDDDKLAPSNPPNLAPSSAPARNVRKGTKTTAETTAETTNNDVVSALEGLGLTRQQAVTAHQTHGLSLADVEVWARWKQSLTGQRRRDAVFAGLIKKQRLPPGAPASRSAPGEGGANAPQRVATAVVQRRDGTTIAQPMDAIWRSVLDDLGARVARNEYETWLKPTFLLAVEDGLAIIGAPNIFVRQELEGRYLGMLADTLQGALGYAVEAQIVIGGPRAE